MNWFKNIEPVRTSSNNIVMKTVPVQIILYWFKNIEPVQIILYWFKTNCTSSNNIVLVQKYWTSSNNIVLVHKFCTGSKTNCTKVKIKLQHIHHMYHTSQLQPVCTPINIVAVYLSDCLPFRVYSFSFIRGKWHLQSSVEKDYSPRACISSLTGN